MSGEGPPLMGNLRRSMEAESCLQDVEIDRGPCDGIMKGVAASSISWHNQSIAQAKTI
jgi:hypothetical protein